jgi:predicted nucleic acid-binding Zn ribbon protein
VKHCTNCGAANPSDARFCAKCGEVFAASSATDRAVAQRQPIARWKVAAMAVVALLLLTMLYFWLFVADDLGSSRTADGPAAGNDETDYAATRQLYTITEVNIRDHPTTKDSMIIGKLPRGSAVTGTLKMGVDGTGGWFELADGKGYIADINLSDTRPPVLTKTLGDKLWVTDVALDIWSQPDSGSSILDRVGEGTKLTLAGLTGNDYAEVKLAGGGIGYVADGAAILSRMGGTPVAVAFNPANCRFGGDIDAEFEKIGARMRAQWAALEAKEFPDDAAREKAMSAIEGRSSYQRLQRAYAGLTITGIAQHYESQSVYFADPPERVIAVFRGKGFQIARDGSFPATELYAGISSTRGEGTAFGKSELGCGV